MQNTQPVQVCYGTESYLLQDYIRTLVARLVEPEQREFGVSRYDLAETPLEAVLDDAETAPFLVPKKVIIASNAVFFTGAKDNSRVEHRVERLAEYMKSPADHTVLLFAVDAEKLDERKKIVKTLKEKRWLHAFAALSPEDLSGWVAKRASAMHFTFTPDALETFLLYTGGHLQAIAAETEKLSLYIGGGGQVTEELVDKLVVRSTEQNVFLLVEDVVKLRMDRAFATLYELLKQREEPIKLLALLARQYRMILQVKELLAQGYSHQQIAGHIGAHPYPVKLAAEQGRTYSPGKLSGILSRLADLDYRIKSGKIDKVLGLELLLLDISR